MLTTEVWSSRSPLRPEASVVKRIVALEGEKVRMRDQAEEVVVEVPHGHVWVEGDNLDGRKTLDSKTYGPISANLITGRVTWVLYPFHRFGRIRWWEHESKTKVWGREEERP